MVTLSPEGFTYSGGESKPSVRVSAPLADLSDISLTEGADFTATYPDDMVSISTKTITINGINNFVGEF